MRDPTRIVFNDFMARLAFNLGIRHRAVTVLLDNTRSRSTVADDTFICAGGKSIDVFACSFSA
jgi:hypothetical protein